MTKQERAWTDLYESNLPARRWPLEVFVALILGLAAGVAAGFFFFMQ